MSWQRWVRTVEVEPSLYAADFSRLGEQIETLLRSGARVFHFDVGDGRFVPPVTIGPIVLKWISPAILDHEGAIDCHLMVDEPAKHFEAIREAGGSSVTFHYEAVETRRPSPRRRASTGSPSGSRSIPRPRSRTQPLPPTASTSCCA